MGSRETDCEQVRPDESFTAMLGLFLLCLLAGLCSSSPINSDIGSCQPVHGRCTDLAMDFLREVGSLQDCRTTCRAREGCQFYSYQGSEGSGSQHRHCYLYNPCTSLRHSHHQHWVTGASDQHSDCYTRPFIVAVHNLLRPT